MNESKAQVYKLLLVHMTALEVAERGRVLVRANSLDQAREHGHTRWNKELSVTSFHLRTLGPLDIEDATSYMEEVTNAKDMDDAAPEIETGWVIERYRYSVLQYWCPSPGEFWGGFTEHIDKAVRFARPADAALILRRMEGMGRVAQHSWPR